MPVRVKKTRQTKRLEPRSGSTPLSVLDIVIAFPTPADNLHDPAGDAKING
jgi:hypothetical protein